VSDSEDKTELPSSKRLKDALEKGNVIVSRELYNFFALLGYSLFFIFLLSRIAKALLPHLKAFIEFSWNPHFLDIVLLYFTKPLALVLPIFILFIFLALLANFLHHRQFVISFKLLAPNFSRISPASGFKKLFSKKIVFEGVKVLMKVVLVGCVSFFAFKEVTLACSTYFSLSIIELLKLVHYKVASIVLVVFLLFSLLAGFDYFFQARSYIEGLKMTKGELMREYRETEGNPQIKGRMKARMSELAKGQFSSVIARASVVIWNAESVAVVLQQDSVGIRLKLKGKGKTAAHIAQMAQSMGVPVIVSKSLASSLHLQVGVNCLVPEHYYAHITALKN
jgi:flagellar biosynthesis protein FlhB